VTLLSARDLPVTKKMSAKSDPYVLFYMHESEASTGNDMGKVQRSETKWNELYPTWNAEFVFGEISSKLSHLRIVVMDATKVGRDEMIGTIVVPLKELLDQRGVTRWHPVEPVSSKIRMTQSCALRLRLRFLYSKVVGKF
jgi:Ca2+-dependent lipid-binding protein